MVADAAGLADQPQPRHALEQCRIDAGALADQDQGFGVGRLCGERRVVVAAQRGGDLDVVAMQALEAAQVPDRVLVIVRDQDAHRLSAVCPASGTG